MDLNAWREKRAGKQYILPSGLVVSLRPVTIYDLALLGKIPTPLVGLANEQISKSQAITVEMLPKFGEIAKLVVTAAIVEPPVAEEADETHIKIDELSAMDLIQVYVWATQEVQALAPFRAGAGEPAGAGRAGKTVRKKAE